MKMLFSEKIHRYITGRESADVFSDHEKDLVNGFIYFLNQTDASEFLASRDDLETTKAYFYAWLNFQKFHNCFIFNRHRFISNSVLIGVCLLVVGMLIGMYLE